MVAPSKMAVEPDAFIRHLGLRTVNDIMDDMNREFEEARTEKLASRQGRRREAERQRKAARRAARAVETGPVTAPQVSCLLEVAEKAK